MLIHKEKMNTNLEYLKTLIHSKQHSEKFYVCKNNDMLKNIGWVLDDIAERYNRAARYSSEAGDEKKVEKLISVKKSLNESRKIISKTIRDIENMEGENGKVGRK